MKKTFKIVIVILVLLFGLYVIGGMYIFTCTFNIDSHIYKNVITGETRIGSKCDKFSHITELFWKNTGINTVLPPEVPSLSNNDSLNNSNKLVTEDKVILKLEDGKEKVYQNNHAEGWGNYVIYNYVDYIKEINCYEISAMNYDGGNMYLLVNKSSGEEIWLPGKEMILSPNKEKIVSYNADYIGDSYNGFVIVKLEDNHFQKELEINSTWFPLAANWVNDTEIEITKIDTIKDFDYFFNTKVIPTSASKVEYFYIDNLWAESF